MVKEKVGKGTATRYPLSTKLDAVTDYYKGVDKKVIIIGAGCSVQSLDDWIKKYSEEVLSYYRKNNIPLVTTADTGPPIPPLRRSNGSLELTEEERVAIVKESYDRGVKVTAEARFIDRSSLGCWRQCYTMTGYTLKSLAIANSPSHANTYVLREVLRKRRLKRTELDKEIQAIEEAIGIVEGYVNSNDAE